MTRQQQGIYVHGEVVTQSPVHGGLVPQHGGTGIGNTGPVHGSSNVDTSSSSPTFPASASLLASDGFHAWYSDPRAIDVSGTLLWLTASGTTSAGNIELHRLGPDGTRDTFLVCGKIGVVDDHDNGCIVKLSSGKIVVFYGQHTDQKGTRYRVSLGAAPNIGGFGPEQSIASSSGSSSYQNAYLLGDGNIYLFRRRNYDDGTNGRRTELCVETEAAVEAGTATWATKEVIFSNGNQRPYPVFCKNGTNRIDVFISNGHPAEVSDNSLYHAYLSVADGTRRWYKSDGTELVSAKPFDVASTLTAIQTNTAANTNESWTAEVRIGADGYPRCLSTRYPTSVGTTALTDIEYWHHRWTGAAWINTRISQDNRSLYAAEAGYAPLLCFDGNDTSIIYMIENDATTHVAEVKQYSFNESTATISQTAVLTSGSAGNNARPFSPIGHGSNDALIWCRETSAGSYVAYTNYEMDCYVLGAVTDHLAAPASYEAETTALLARMSVQPSATRKIVIDRRIKRLKAAPYSGSNIWAKKGLDYVFQAHDAQAARLNWIGATGDLTVSGAPVFTANRGYKGTANATDVLTSIAPNAIPNWTQNGAHIHGFAEWASPTGSIVRRSASGSPVLLNAGATGTTVLRVNNAVGVTLPIDNFQNGQGFMTSSRTGASAGTVYKNGGVTASDATASSAPDTAALLMAYQHSGGNIMAVSLGGSLTQAEVADMVFADWEYSRDARS